MAFRHILLNFKLVSIVIIILFTVKCKGQDPIKMKELSKNNTKFNYNDSNGIYLMPLHYDVQIKFDVYRNFFLGKCNIIIQINRTTENITMISSKIIVIVKIELTNNNNQTVNIQKFSFINKTYLFLNFSQSSVEFLSPGTYILKIEYVRTILDDGDVFESYYTDKEVLNNEVIKVIQRAELLPCWNELTSKSTFNISIYHHKNYKLISHMPIQEEIENKNNMRWTHLYKSSLMSVQHFTIVIINTVVLFNYSTKNVEFWCRNKIMPNSMFAKDIAHKIVHFLKEKSENKGPRTISYVVIKNSQYFQYRHMKILGVVLLKEEDIIYSNASDHISNKIRVANLIAQQTISQWYDDVFLWSKEGFIIFFAAHILNQSQLIYRMMDLFVVQTQQESLRFDILSDVDSISLPVYIKSSVIWRMLHHLMSDNVFWTSIIYKDLRYILSNASQIGELWNCMQFSLNNSGNPHNINIRNIMNIWMIEKQYPELLMKRNYSARLIVFKFMNSNKFDKQTNWSTLVTYASKSNNYYFFWMNQLLLSYSRRFDQNEWIIVNLQQAGYYRVNYNTVNWKSLVGFLRKNVTRLHVLNRAQIIDDAFYFFTQRQLSYLMFWNITSILFKETDYIVWYPMIKAVEYMTCIWPVQNYPNLKNKIQEMFYKLLLNIGYYEQNHEKDFTKYLREEAVQWLCVFGHPECLKIATIELEKNLQNSIQDKYLKWEEWIYCKGLMAANHSFWLKVYKIWNETNNIKSLEYLTCSTNAEINLNYLNLAITNKFKYEHLGVSDIKKWVNIILLILAKHAKIDTMLEFVLNKLEIIYFSSKREIDQIVILIVIITHEHSVEQLRQIEDVVKCCLTMTMNDTRLIGAVKQKIKKRKNEYKRRVTNYGTLKLY